MIEAFISKILKSNGYSLVSLTLKDSADCSISLPGCPNAKIECKEMEHLVDLLKKSSRSVTLSPLSFNIQEAGEGKSMKVNRIYRYEMHAIRACAC